MMQRGSSPGERGMQEAVLRMATDFSTRALTRCSKACITSIKSSAPTDSEQACLENCFMKHTALFSEGLKKMSDMMKEGSGPQ